MADESIYNLIPRDSEAVGGGSQRYKSQYSGQVRQEYQQTKDFSKTMGPLRVDPGSPAHFLKKGEGTQSVSPTRPPEPRTQSHSLTRPPVPKHDELTPLAEPTSKNFIRENTMEVLRAVPKKAEPVILDRTSGPGGRQVLEESGLVPKYSKKEDFGKVPDYLTQRKEHEAQYQRDRQAHLDAMSRAGAPRQLSGDERQRLLDGLKANWTQLHHDYQALSVVTDTVSKRQRKKRLEEKLASLEADIRRVESHPVIYVED